MKFNPADPGDRPIKWRDPNTPPPRRTPLPYPEDPESDTGRFNIEMLRVLTAALLARGMWELFRYGPFGSEDEAAAAEATILRTADLLGLKVATLRQGWRIQVRSALEQRESATS